MCDFQKKLIIIFNIKISLFCIKINYFVISCVVPHKKTHSFKKKLIIILDIKLVYFNLYFTCCASQKKHVISGKN